MKFTTIDDLPLFLTARDIADTLKIGLANAYELCHSKGFPCVKIGKRLVVPKLAFIAWMEAPSLVKRH